MEALGSLSFLMNDIANSVITTGIPSFSLEEPVRNLKCSLTKLITSLSDQIKSRENADYYDLLEVSYSARKNLSQPGGGRERYEVTKDQFEHLRSLCFSWQAIAGILQVSISTTRGRREEFCFTDSGYSDVPVDVLDEIYRSITGSSTTGALTPNIGRRRFMGALRSRGLNVQRWRIGSLKASTTNDRTTTVGSKFVTL